MPKPLQLMKQVRSVVQAVRQGSDNPEHLALLESADNIMKELMLQTDSGFYVDYIRSGKKLLDEGEKLAASAGCPVASPTIRGDFTEETSMTVLDGEITKLLEAMSTVVNALDENRSPAEKDFLVRTTDWEDSLYIRRGQPVPCPRQSSGLDITRESLLDYLQTKFPDWADLKITKFVQLFGGISKQTILFDTEDRRNGKQSLVLRAEVPVILLHYDGSDVTREYHMIQLMEKMGLPVAKTRWLEEDTTLLGGRFIVFDKSPGIMRGSNLGSTEPLPEALVDSMLSTFYKMHNLTLDRNDPLAWKSHLREWLPHHTVYDTTKHYVNVFIPNEIARCGIPMTPDLARGLKWIQNNIPDTGDEKPVIQHMDYSFNNILFDGDRVSAILDWETSRLGDPVDDIVWTQLSLSNVMSQEEFLRRYKEGTGRTVTPYRMAYSQVTKFVLNLIGALNSIHCLDGQDNTPIKFSLLGYFYMPILCTQLNGIIAEAERLKAQG